MCAKSVFERIKKQNGELFAKQIRDFDCGIFEVPGIVEIVKFAGRNAVPLLSYLQQLKPDCDIPIDTGVEMTPFELLHMAGYRAEYADTLEKQNAIEKYFEPGERLCTFNDSTRFQRYHIITAVKYDVNSIHRRDFPHPTREDRYGTSVMTIQVAKDGRRVFITNRYNHGVENSDYTYNDNPDNIIMGLRSSIAKYFDVDFKCPKGMIPPDQYVSVGDMILKYNHRINETYFGDTFYVQDGVIHELNRDCQVMLGYHIFDLSSREFIRVPGIYDSFQDAFAREIDGHPLRVAATRDYTGVKRVTLYIGKRPVVETLDGRIRRISFNNVDNIGDGFMMYDKGIEEIALPHVTKIGANFLQQNKNVRVVAFPQVTSIGPGFLSSNKDLFGVSLPRVETIGGGFMFSNTALGSLSLASVRHIGYGFLMGNQGLNRLELPRVETIDDDFMISNNSLITLNLPCLRSVGNTFMVSNSVLRRINVPSLETIGDSFLMRNTEMAFIMLNNAQTIGRNFMAGNVYMRGIGALNVRNIDYGFLGLNTEVRELNFPHLEHLGGGALSMNKNPDVVRTLDTFYKSHDGGMMSRLMQMRARRHRVR